MASSPTITVAAHPAAWMLAASICDTVPASEITKRRVQDRCFDAISEKAPREMPVVNPYLHLTAEEQAKVEADAGAKLDPGLRVEVTLSREQGDHLKALLGEFFARKDPRTATYLATVAHQRAIVHLIDALDAANK